MKRFFIILILVIILSGCDVTEQNKKTSENTNSKTSMEKTYTLDGEEAKSDSNIAKPNIYKTEEELTKNSEIDDVYYKLLNIPDPYNLYQIEVNPYETTFIYLLDNEKYERSNIINFTCINENANWTMEELINAEDLEKSKYNDVLYFYFDASLNKHCIVYFEYDDLIFKIQFPFVISLDNEEDIKKIERICELDKVTVKQ